MHTRINLKKYEKSAGPSALKKSKKKNNQKQLKQRKIKPARGVTSSVAKPLFTLYAHCDSVSFADAAITTK
jgi:hypothetical protein